MVDLVPPLGATKDDLAGGKRFVLSEIDIEVEEDSDGSTTPENN